VNEDPRHSGFDFAPGMLVRLPGRPDWGLGQVQSAVGRRVTVNFEHGGKQMIDVGNADLRVASDER